MALLRNRRTKKRRIEEQRRIAEEEFAGLTTSLDEFDEKERLVSGYLEAQRPLLGPEDGGGVETRRSPTPRPPASPRSSTRRPPVSSPTPSGRES